jgi:hypothetical protein
VSGIEKAVEEKERSQKMIDDIPTSKDFYRHSRRCDRYRQTGFEEVC